jgi:hypothetical protein
MLHPSHLAYEREYPIASTQFQLYGRIDHPEEQLKKKTGPWSRQRSVSTIEKTVKNIMLIQRRHSQEAMYTPPAWEPMFSYQRPMMLNPCDTAGWKTPIYKIPLEGEPTSKHR